MKEKTLLKSVNRELKNVEATTTKTQIANAIILRAFENERLLTLKIKTVAVYRARKRRAKPKTKM